MVEHLTTAHRQDPLSEVREQNGDLIRALSDLGARQAELVDLNQELEATNRGVVALYAELDEKAEALRMASLQKTRFLSNLTHEFRTPLGSILSLGELLLDGADGDLNAGQAKLVSLITKSSRDLLELVNDLLDLAKVEAGKIPVKRGEFTIDALFESLRGLLRPLANKNPAVELRFEVRDAADLSTDEGKVTQILRNLISNALKYTPSGSVAVVAELAPGATEVIFTVSDTGIGIATADLARIFEEFVQIENPHQAQHKGTGLGLSLTERLVNVLGGKLVVRSIVGKGTDFEVRLPVQYEGAASVEYGRPAPRNLAELSASVPGARVLIIDDDASERDFLKRILVERYSVELREAATGAAGLEIARSAPLDVIFLDLNLPELDGFQVLRELKANPRTAHTPVLIYSSKRLTDEDHLRLAGNAGILAKSPANSPEFRAELSETLGRLGIREHGRSLS